MKVIDIFNDKEKSFVNDTKDANIEILAKYVNTIEDNNITIDAIKNHLNKISTEKLSYIQKENFNSKINFLY